MKRKTNVFAMLMVLLMVVAGYAQQEPTKPPSTGQQVTSEDSQPPKVIHREMPIYPPEARAKRILGTVRVEAVIDKQGHVTSARVVQGPKIFWDAALEAIKGWRFEPATVQGQPVEKTFQVQLEFRDRAPAADQAAK
jgi:TonB family protein